MCHALGRQEGVGQIADFTDAASQDQNLQAEIGVDMRVERGNRHIVMTVLRLNELFAELWPVVMIEESDAAHGPGLGRLTGGAAEFLPHEVPDRLRAAAIPLSSDIVVKACEEVFLHGHAEAYNL